MKTGKDMLKLSRSQWISVAVLASSMGLAAAVTLPFPSFTAGSLISASQMNQNFAAMGTAVTAAETGIADLNTAVATKANSADVYTKAEIDASFANGMKAAASVSSTGTVSTLFVAFGTFTVAKIGTGIYSITVPGLFPGCNFVNAPFLMVTPTSSGTAGSSQGVSAQCLSGDTSVTVFTRNTAGTFADASFNFVLYAKPGGALPVFPAAAGNSYTSCRIDAEGVKTCT